jgi:hypothetical protein
MNKIPFIAIFIIALLTLSSCSKKTKVAKDSRDFISLSADETMDLGNKSLRIRDNETLGDKTLYKNGKLVGSNTRIEAGYLQIFDKVSLEGTWQNDTFPLAWFVSGRDATENFLAILQILRMDKTVLLDRMYPIATPDNWPILNFPNNIDITGINNENCGLTLLSSFSRNNGYFNTIHGNNIRLHNIRMNTAESVAGNYENESRFVFVNCFNNSLVPDANPDFDYVEIKNCRVSGNVMLRYTGNTKDPQLTRKGIKSISITDNHFDHAGRFFSISNATYGNAEFSRNTGENCTSILFGAGISGQGFDHGAISRSRKMMRFEDNTIINSRAIMPSDNNYLSPIVAKGWEFIVKNNRIENMLSINPNVVGYGFYCSASNHLLVEDNYIRNCGGISSSDQMNSASLIKLKHAENMTVRNNEFHFDREGLQLLGLIRPNQPLSAVNSRLWKLCIFDHWDPGLDSTSILRMENNVFKSAVLSDFSHMFNAHISMTGNRFEIDYFLDTPEDNWGGAGVRLPFTFFYFRSPIKDGSFIFDDNQIIVKESAGGPLYLTHNRNDDKNFEKISYQNNVFDVSHNIGIDVGRTKEFIADNSSTGRGAVFFNHPTTLRHNAFVSNTKISHTSASIQNHHEGFLNIRALGTASFKVQQPDSDQITLMNIRFSDYNFFEENDSLPISVHLNISYRRGQRRHSQVYHLVIDGGNTCFHNDTRGRQTSSGMIWSQNRDHFKNEIGTIKSSTPGDVRLFWSSHAANFSRHHHGFLVLEGLRGVTDLDIEARVVPTPVSNRRSNEAKQSSAARSVFE